MASEEGVAIKKTLLDGKPFQKIIDHARKTNPWLIVLGRIGVHSPKDETALGSNTENILRAAPCDVLLSTRLEVPRLDVRAEETVRWTPEAEERMTHVPEQVKGIARTGVLRLALEKGHSVVTNAVIDEAMDRFMPKSASAATKALAEAVALERAKSGPVSMCKSCGVAATQSGAVKCTVCGGTDFEVISQEMIEKIAAVEGGLQEETTYDGRKLRWSEDARKGLWTMKNAYQRRRVKARVEKRARMMKLDAITLDFARQVIEEETGAPLEIQGRAAQIPEGAAAGAGEARLVARDDKKNPLISTFEWTADAAQRVLRVPAGFMRNQTQERIEELARERAAAVIDLALVEDGIEIGKRMMAEMIKNYPSQGKSPAVVTAARDSAAGSAASNGNGYLNEVSARPSSVEGRPASGEHHEG
jgi:Zn finger protein HypA/HybF involved in hydrogenase expression